MNIPTCRTCAQPLPSTDPAAPALDPATVREFSQLDDMVAERRRRSESLRAREDADAAGFQAKGAPLAILGQGDYTREIRG